MDIQPTPTPAISAARSMKVMEKLDADPQVKAAEDQVTLARRDHDRADMALKSDVWGRRALYPEMYQKSAREARTNGILAQALVGGAGLAIGLTHAIGPASGIVGVLMMGLGVLTVDKIIEARAAKRVDGEVKQTLTQVEHDAAGRVQTAETRARQVKSDILQRLLAEAAADEAKGRPAGGTVTVEEEAVQIGAIRVPRKDGA